MAAISMFFVLPNRFHNFVASECHMGHGARDTGHSVDGAEFLLIRELQAIVALAN